ncbi:ASCH domain-containing protein [Lactobacillus kalixensis]|nr:ASCH domain-containing protein [Lactobacillus kalixensis]
MKALSVRGDYIMDMIAGKKKIEYRSWKTNYRGPLLMCSTAKKVAGAAPGYALCVVNLVGIEYFDWDGLYHWRIELADVIKPIPVKGQLKLFNVDDNRIHPISMQEFKSEVAPLLYLPRKRKN